MLQRIQPNYVNWEVEIPTDISIQGNVSVAAAITSNAILTQAAFDKANTAASIDDILILSIGLG
jgi:hypothetical protein